MLVCRNIMHASCYNHTKTHFNCNLHQLQHHLKSIVQEQCAAFPSYIYDSSFIVEIQALYSSYTLYGRRSL